MKFLSSYLKIPAPNSWNEFPLGPNYRFEIQQYMQPWWPKFFGFYLLKIGALSTEIDTRESKIPHQINVGERGDQMQVIVNLNQLPFSKKSSDVCLLFHVLSAVKDPYRLLREVDRILVDDGWLVISHFNSFSLLGIGKLLPVIKRRQPYVCPMFSRMRVLNWLGLLNYEIVHQIGFHVLPWHDRGEYSMNIHSPAISCLSLIIARKRTTPLSLDALKLRTPKRCFSPINTENYKI
ncbi:methyltransferase domain-containing protein [Candidatus Williamhamiltonella defendens]|uniref:methyltransferase domain-containing protein n=1 Tax=Candidatus Williamhamiltonella defendens TaxID=138072 RepID=UPI00130E190D|nr:methyltransferase domain-containing protein [Candidatus Hamiltonella defensa]